ncbi:serine protease [Erythrobacter sp. GH1-10]|uniref:serine protease n=1 Tax=Erythrobacter sp. GH1-10 TaxID=3349334 RepID=UPI003878022F
MIRFLSIMVCVLLIGPGTAVSAQDPDDGVGGEIIQQTENGTGVDHASSQRPPKAFPADLAPLRIRLSDALEESQRAAVMAVLDATPNVLVEQVATYEIAPNPSLPDHLVLFEIKGASANPQRALARSMQVEGAMTLQDVMEFFSTESARHHAWASNVPLPVELGDPSREDFAADLSGRIAGLRRRAGLVSVAQSSEPGRISVCLSNRVSKPGSCPLPEDNLGPNEASTRYPIYLTVSSPADNLRYFSLAAMDREGDITPIPVVPAIETPSPSGDPQTDDQNPSAEASAQPPRAYAVSYGDLADRLPPGNYELLVVSSPEQIDPRLWETRTGPETTPDVCNPIFERAICQAMTGRNVALPYEWNGDFAVIPISIRGAIVRELVRGNFASSAVRPWQAQLLRYAPRAPGSSSGAANRIDFISSHKCGGSYLGDGFVLTAAHCILDDPGEMRVRLGANHIEYGGTTFKVRSLVQHKKGSSRNGRVDLAVIQLIASQKQLARVANLASIDPADDPDAKYTLISGLTVTGWGFEKPRKPGETGWEAADGTRQTQPDRLLQLVLQQQSASDCTKVPEFSAYRAADILCLKGVPEYSDSCAGDSGGPVSSRGARERELVGVVSSGVGCAFTGEPAVYVNVARYAGWIERAKTLMRTKPRGYYELGGR